ncbi:hypothetical protein [Sutterella wadsworthensis]|uniref:hypothetical protein n=1 Tax=Sutterella wadsworthensis TaxID=40545 RepID=UPI00241DE0A1|nr:hypothetical protein [Sutterella wadsworthensis]
MIDFSEIDPKSITEEDCIAELKAVQQVYPETLITRAMFRDNTTLPERVWAYHFGTFNEFRRHAGVLEMRGVSQYRNQTAKHSASDVYRALNEEKAGWGEKYLRDNPTRYKTILAVSDLHDIDVDPFFLRVLIDTARRVQPDVISIVGDLFDLPEFGKYTVDPREWNAVERIKFVHNAILKPLREVCPDAQIDLIEGNHEARILRLLADATPALRSVLSDLHGMSIQTLLGLDKFQVNYISKSDLAAWTKADLNKEVANNYRIYYDSVLFHHMPQGESMGMPGCHGHHHRHKVNSHFSPVFGHYEWHQLGCGHKRSASYCEGERWGMGFALINVDTKTKQTVFDYIPVSDFAVSGGLWYYRRDDEPAL